MPEPQKRKQLKIEALPSDDNALEQLMASLARIQDGLSGMQALVEGVAAQIAVVANQRTPELKP